jgi:hypothetical protein
VNSPDEFHLQLVSLAIVSGLKPRQLCNLLADEAVREARWGDYARLERGSLTAMTRRLGDWLHDLRAELSEVTRQSPRIFWDRQWLDVLVGASVLLGLGLFFAYRLFPVCWSDREAVLIASKDLEPGRELVAADWVEGQWLPVSDDRLPAKENPTGWRVRHRIYGGQPLRSADLERQQVVATRDIVAGEIVTTESIELALSTVVLGALLELRGAAGQQTSQKIVTGMVITTGLLKAPLARSPRVVAAGWLPAFRVLRSGDVIGDPAGPAAAELLRDVEGQLILYDLAEGEPVAGALLTLPFPVADLASRRVIFLDSLAGGFELRAGSRISLWVTPSGNVSEAFEIVDVAVLQVGKEGGALVALGEAEATRLTPFIGRAEIVVWRLVSVP